MIKFHREAHDEKGEIIHKPNELASLGVEAETAYVQGNYAEYVELAPVDLNNAAIEGEDMPEEKPAKKVKK